MNLPAFLTRSRVEFEFLAKRSTRHASEASRASGIALDKIAKTLVFVDQDSKVLIAVVRGDHKVSRHKLQRCSGSKSIKIAPPKLAEEATGYPTGGIPPVGHRRKLPVYIDREVLAKEWAWCGGGTRTRLVRLKTTDIVRLNHALVCDIAVR